jgi:hypothetical protein
MSFLCLGLSLADLASWAGPVASGESRGPMDIVPWPATSLRARGGEEVLGVLRCLSVGRYLNPAQDAPAPTESAVIAAVPAADPW